MGWSTPWQAAASVSDGTVTITGVNGTQRVFQPDSRNAGTYFSQPGDTGSLHSDGSGGYKLTEADGTTTDFNSNGTLNYIQDTNGNRITAGYTSGRLTTLTASSGQSITIGYNGAGLITSVSDSQGRWTTYAYDATNRYLISVTSFNGQTTNYTYNTTAGSAALNALTSIAFPGGTHEYFTYDGFGRLRGTSNDGGAQPETFAYSQGQVTTTDGVGDASQLFFNEQGMVIKNIDPLGNVTINDYDGNLNLTSVTNALGQSQTYTYNSVGEVTSSTDFLGYTTQFTYSGPFNDLSSMTDAHASGANVNTTIYTYDSHGNLTQTTYANGTTSSATYDPMTGNARSFLNANGQPINYTYNSAGQVLTETFSDGTSFTFKYDGLGNLITATDSTGITTFTYDPVTQLLTSVTYPNAMSLTFTYNAAGQRTRSVDQTGFTVKYAYDSAGRLAGLTDGSGNPIVTYTYDAAGRLSRKVNGNLTYTTYTYDADGNIKHLVNYAPGGAVNSQFDYTYNALGLQTIETTLDGTWNYSYDPNGQLIGAVFTSNNPNVPSQNLAYFYDAMGNRLMTTINGATTTYVPNNMNEYTSVGGMPYTYDADGNLTNDGTNTYTYNSLNQLTSVAGAGGTTKYTYNSLGQRVAATTNGVTTQYLIDPAGLGSVVGQATSSGTVAAQYTYGLGLASQITTSGSSFYDFDALGSTAGVSNSLGSYVDTYSYLPFGGILSSNQPMSNSFQFVGQFGVTNDGNGVDFMRARSYSVNIGRFTSRDPLIAAVPQTKAYEYTGNSPTGGVDPVGLSTLSSGQNLLLGSAGVGLGGLALAGGTLGTIGTLGGFLVGGVTLGTSAGDYFEENYPDQAAQVGDALYNFFNPTLPPNDPQPPPEGTDQGMVFQMPPEAGPPGFPFGGLGTPQNPATPPAPSGGSVGDDGDTSSAFPTDPNALIGPGGYGPPNFVPVDPPSLPYQIDFSNATSASSPAQDVTITDQLDPNLDWTTFQLTGIRWGDTILSIPAGSQYYQTTVPMTENGESFNVLVQAGINTGTGQILVTFQSIDPKTQLRPNVLSRLPAAGNRSADRNR